MITNINKGIQNMKTSKKLMTAAALTAFVAGSTTMVQDANAAKKGYEKCMGVVKAGMNDCGANGHSCAGQAKVDSDPNEWVYLPEGTCDKLAGGHVKGMKK